MTMDGVENVARRAAVVCAVLLLLGPFGGRTTWEAVQGSSAATDAGGYNAIVVAAGVAALIALGFAHWARPGRVLSLLGMATAVTAFGLGVYATAVFVVARWQGGIWVYACWCYAAVSPGWTVTPAPGPPIFMVVALVGAIASVVLAVSWMRQPKSEAVALFPLR